MHHGGGLDGRGSGLQQEVTSPDARSPGSALTVLKKPGIPAGLFFVPFQPCAANPAPPTSARESYVGPLVTCGGRQYAAEF